MTRNQQQEPEALVPPEVELPAFPPGSRKRVLVLGGDDAPPVAAANVYANLLREHDLRFIEERVLSVRRITRFSLRRLQKKGPLSLLDSYLFYLEKLLAGERPEKRRYRPELRTAALGTDPAVRAFLRSFKPDLILIGFCGVLPPDFLQAAGCPIINIHPGVNPRYRGFGNLWALSEGNSACTGYTIHAVDEGVDTGGRIAAAPVDFSGIPLARLDSHAARLAAAHLSGILLGTAKAGIPAAWKNLPSAFYGVPTRTACRRAQHCLQQSGSAAPFPRAQPHQAQGNAPPSPRKHPHQDHALTPPPERAMHHPPSPARHILITGASGGLGAALALAYAAPGIRLTLWARDMERLHALAARCQSAGAEAHCIGQDIRHTEATRDILERLDRDYPVDLAFLNAGVSSGTLPDGRPEPAEDACRTLEVNATGNINMASLLLERMAERRSGQVALTSSLAALYPLPDSPAYCAAKAAVTWYAKAMRGALATTPVRVSILYPGYVDSPMSRRLAGPQPLRWSAEKAAAHIRARLEAGADNVIFPRLLALGTCLLHLLPRPAARFFLRRFGFTIQPDAEALAGKTKTT